MTSVEGLNKRLSLKSLCPTGELGGGVLDLDAGQVAAAFSMGRPLPPKCYYATMTYLLEVNANLDFDYHNTYRRSLFKYVLKETQANAWRVYKRDRDIWMRDLSLLAISEFMREGLCQTCRGTGEYWMRHHRGEICKRCMGSGLSPRIFGEELDWMLQEPHGKPDADHWRKTWQPRLNVLVSTISGWNTRGLRHLVRHIDDIP